MCLDASKNVFQCVCSPQKNLTCCSGTGGPSSEDRNKAFVHSPFPSPVATYTPVYLRGHVTHVHCSLKCGVLAVLVALL